MKFWSASSAINIVSGRAYPFALQMFSSSENFAEAVKHNPERKRVVDFVLQFRSVISSEVTESGKYSFKAFLIQVANHKSENVLPIRFVHHDRLSDDEKNQCLN